MNRHSIHAGAGVRAALLMAIAMATACMSTDTTSISDGAFFAISSVMADSSSYPAGTVLIVRAKVTHAGAAVDSANVGWAVAAGGGVVSAATTFSDTSGVAMVAWTLGAVPGANTLVMGIGDAVDTLHVEAVVGEPSYVVAQGADSFTIAAGASATLQAELTDRAGNPVPSVSVSWSASGGALSAAATTTGSNGVASVAFEAGAPGTYLITADLPGVASHTYQVVVQ
jgi:adhesin/invasin